MRWSTTLSKLFKDMLHLPIEAIFLFSTHTPVSSVVLAVTPKSLHVFTRVFSNLAIYLQIEEMELNIQYITLKEQKDL